MVQETSASTTLPRQSRAGALPSQPWGKTQPSTRKEVQTSIAASGSPHLYHSTIRNAVKTEETPLKRRLVKRYWICLSDAFQVSVSASFWLRYLWRKHCALLPTGGTEDHGNEDRRSTQAWPGHGPPRCGTGKVSSIPCHVQTRLIRQSCRPLGTLYVGQKQDLLPFSAISEDVLHCALLRDRCVQHSRRL